MKYFLLVLLFIFSLHISGQCAMCRAVLESEEGGIKGEAVNDGIVYLMTIPYLLIIAIGYLVYSIKKK